MYNSLDVYKRQVLVLFGIGETLLKKTFDKGIWFVGIGTVLTGLSLLLVAGYNNTAYYPSYTDQMCIRDSTKPNASSSVSI